MKNNQKGSVEIIVPTVLVILLVLVAVQYALAIGQNNRINTWTRDCNNSGGTVSQVEHGITKQRFECFVDGEKVTLPGWEGY